MSTELKVEGMDCTNCALGIKRRLDKSGFSNVDVDFASGRVTFDEEDVNQVRIAVKEIRGLGYEIADDKNRKPSFFARLENRLWISGILTLPLLAHMVIPWHPLHSPWVQLVLATPVYLLGMAFFGKSAWNSIKAGVANMDVLVTLGASAAFFYSLYGTLMNLGPNYQFYESAATIITVIMLGNLLEKRSVKKTGSVIDEMEKLSGEKAKRMIKDSEQYEDVDVSGLIKGDWVQVNQGDPVPADGFVIFGRGSADESLMTGESMPVAKSPGDKLLAGTVIVQGIVRMEVTAKGPDTMLSAIINLVRQAQKDKPKLQNLADRISAVFVPAVVVIAIATFIISHFLLNLSVEASMLRGIAVLVVACPCALGLAIPTAVMVGIGLAAKRGILIKKASLFDNLSKARTIIFDKTGTLTTGNFSLGETVFDGIDEDQGLRIIYNLEKHSSHPLAKSLIKEIGAREDMNFVEIEEVPGEGIKGSSDDGHVYWFGKGQGTKAGMEYDLTLKIDGVERGYVNLSDDFRPGANDALARLRELHMELVMLTGDREVKAQKSAKALGFERVYSGQKPADKLNIVSELSRKEETIMVGDGINDAPALSRAGVGVSFGSATGAAINSAQVILLRNQLSALPSLLRISRMTQTTIQQNLFWAFFYNVLMIPVAALGWLNPMVAALAMAFSDVIVVLNSLRLRWRMGRSKATPPHTVLSPEKTP